MAQHQGHTALQLLAIQLYLVAHLTAQHATATGSVGPGQQQAVAGAGKLQCPTTDMAILQGQPGCNLTPPERGPQSAQYPGLLLLLMPGKHRALAYARGAGMENNGERQPLAAVIARQGGSKRR